MTRRVIWCLGLYASASTWLFNVIREIAIAAQPHEIRTHFVSGIDSLDALDHTPAVILIKSHEISDEATLIKLASRANNIFITVRDPRDAVASLMQYHGHDFSRALQLVEQASQQCSAFSKDQRAMVFRYEDKFFELPATIQTVARHLGYTLSQQAAQEIFNRLDRTAVERHIAGLRDQPDVLRDPLSGDFFDPKTHWHAHHSGRTGEIGKWQKSLTESQLQEIIRRVQCPSALHHSPAPEMNDPL